MDFQQIYSNKRKKTVAGIKKAIAESERGVRSKCQKLYLSPLWPHM